MPLSKKRDKARKQIERAKIRLDKQLTPSAGANGVQPKLPNSEELPSGVSYIDADGNMVYE